jgi:hypothetical protein
MTTFVCVRCQDRKDTADGYREAPRHGNQPTGSLFCGECIRDLEDWEKEAAILRRRSA